MRRWMVALIATGVVLTACSGDDGTAESPASSEGSVAREAGDEGAGEDTPSSGGSGTASVTVGATSYEFSTPTDCFPDPKGPTGLAIRFDDGADFVSLNQIGETVLVRARLDGVEYVDDGSADPPMVSGGNVTWSGVMSGGGQSQDIQMSLSC